MKLARVYSFTNEITVVANQETTPIAMEEAIDLSVQFTVPSCPADADFDITLYVSNDGVVWVGHDSIGTTGNSIYSSPGDSKYFEATCRARFIKVLIENYTEVTAPTVLTTTINIIE